MSWVEVTQFGYPVLTREDYGRLRGAPKKMSKMLTEKLLKKIVISLCNRPLVDGLVAS